MTISILLVDDSEVIRFLFTKSLERDPELRVVATAGNGLEAIDMAKKHKPAVVLLDIEMPQMDGLTALPRILEVSPLSRIIVISGNTHENVNAALDSLRLGAIEFVLKPGTQGASNTKEFNEELRQKIKAISGTPNTALRPPAKAEPEKPAATPTPAPRPPAAPEVKRPAPARPAVAEAPPVKQLAPVTVVPLKTTSPAVAAIAEDGAAPATVRPTKFPVKAVTIASSTGGPESLMELFEGLQGSLLHVPIFITQHMPAAFTAALAEHISRSGKRTCIEAIDGQLAKAGVTYVAPGGYHMVVRGTPEKPTLHLTMDPPVNSCRPSADPMFSSLSHVYGSGLLAVVLTGIGQDGMVGAKAISQAGGSIIAQDKDSCVVYGMPKAVAEIGICEAILPLNSIAAYLKRRCS